MKKTVLLTICITAWMCVTQNANAQWNQQTSGTTDTLRAVQFLDANNGYAVGDAGTVLKTTDAGATWTDVSIASNNMVYDLSFTSITQGWICTGDPNDAGTTGGVWMTADGGSNWTEQTINSTNARLGISFFDNSTGWAPGANMGPMNVEATTDGGTNWAVQGNAGIFGWIYGIDALSATVAWATGVAYSPTVTGFLVTTTDGGANWTDAGLGTIPFLWGIDFFGSNNGYSVGATGYVTATTDGGTNWAAQTTGTSNDLRSVSFFSATQGWACGVGGTVIATADGGTTWATETTGVTVALFGVSAINDSTVWAVGGAGTIITKGAPLPPGINEQSQAASVRIYPNPLIDNARLIVSGASGLSANPIAVAFFDLCGKKVKQIENITTNNVSISANDLLPGVYFYRVVQGENEVDSGKLIVLN